MAKVKYIFLWVFIASNIIVKSVFAQDGVVETIKISGTAKITYYNETENSYSYLARLYDAQNAEIIGQKFTWELTGNVPSGVEINEQTGVLTVSAPIQNNQKFSVTASKGNDIDISAKKQVVFLDYDTYTKDEKRLSTVIEYIDRVFDSGKDIYQGSPLLANGIDRANKRQIEWRFPKNESEIGSAVMSNLAMQSYLMRTMIGLSEVTGNNKYKNRVSDIYDYYLKNYVSPNGLFYWGGHTMVDLKTGKPCYSTYDNIIHELKDNFPYFDTFFELDNNTTSEIIKNIWAGHTLDFKNLLFNRHAKYDKSIDLNNTWYKTELYADGQSGLLKSTSLPFRITGNDFIHLATQLYEHTGENEALTWATRLWERYISVQDPNTHLGGYQYTTADGADGTLNPLTTLEPLGKWWLTDPLPDKYTWTTYGDRAKNQFEEILISDGIISESKRSLIREANVVFTDELQSHCPFIDLTLAKSVGIQTTMGRKIVSETVQQLASYATIAYIPETNKLRPIWADGTDMSGYVIKRSGYYGKAGTVLSQFPASTLLMASYAKTYLFSSDRSDLSAERAKIWNVVRGIASANDLGELGKQFPGDEISLSLNTTCASPEAVIALVDLYHTTYLLDYLSLARKIADNIVKDYYIGGYFVKNRTSRYVNFNELYSYAVVLLDAAIEGKYEEVPTFLPFNGYFSANYEKEDGTVLVKAWEGSIFWSNFITPNEAAQIEKENMNYDDFQANVNMEGKSVDNFNYWNVDNIKSTLEKSFEFGDDTSFLASNKMMMIDCSNGGEIKKMFRDESGNLKSADGLVNISLELYNKTDGEITTSILNSYGNSLANITFLGGGNAKTNDGKTFTYNQNVGKLTLQLDTKTKKYKLLIQDKIILSDISFVTQWNVVVSGISISGNSEGVWYVDNITLMQEKPKNEFDEFSFSKVSNEKINTVTSNLNLLTSYVSIDNTNYTVSWISENSSVISENGTVIRQKYDTNVNLYAYFTDGINTYRNICPVHVLSDGKICTLDNFESLADEGISVHQKNDWKLTNFFANPSMTSTIEKDPTSQEDFASSNKVMRLRRTSSSTQNEKPYKEIKTDGVLTGQKGEVIVNMRLYNKIGGGGFSISVNDNTKSSGSGSPIAMLYFTPYGNLINSSQIMYQPVKDSVTNVGEWFELTMVVNIDKHYYDVYINFEKVNKTPLYLYSQYDENASVSVSSIEFDIKKETTKECIWYVDDVLARKVDECDYQLEYLTFSDEFSKIEDFNSGYKIGQSVHLQNNWQLVNVTAQPTLTSSVEIIGENEYALMLKRTAKNTVNERPYYKVVEKGELKELTGDIRFDMRLQAVKINGYFSIAIKDSKILGGIDNGNTLINTILYQDGKVIDGVSWGTIAQNAFPKNAWFDYSIIINTKNNSYDILVNNKKINTNPLPIISSTPDNVHVSVIEFDIKKEVDVETIWYIDDILINQSQNVNLAGTETEKTVSANAMTIKQVSFKKLTYDTVASPMCVAIVAIYDKNELIDVSVMEFNPNVPIYSSIKKNMSLKLPKVNDANVTIKTFVWQDFNKLSSLKMK